jgi:hypothetical protein
MRKIRRIAIGMFLTCCTLTSSALYMKLQSSTCSCSTHPEVAHRPIVLVERPSAEGSGHLAATAAPPFSPPRCCRELTTTPGTAATPFPPPRHCREPTTTPAPGSHPPGRHGRFSLPPTSPPQGAGPLPSPNLSAGRRRSRGRSGGLLRSC